MSQFKHGRVLVLVAVMALFVSKACADDIYTIAITLDKNEIREKNIKLKKGKYTFRVDNVNGDADQVYLEAQLAGTYKYKNYCPKGDDAVKVEFTVASDGDRWDITITNKSSTNKAKVVAKLTKD